MLEELSPQNSPEIRAYIGFLARAAEDLPHAVRSPLITRYDHIYGDLSGQRALTDEDMMQYANFHPKSNNFSKYSFIIAIETYFSTICNLISAAAISKQPIKFLNGLTDLKTSEFKSSLINIISGKYHFDSGLSHYENSAELDWFGSLLAPHFVDSIKFLVRSISHLWEGEESLFSLHDPIQLIHDAVFPKNLVHVTGQFYTPPWLCDVLIKDMNPALDSLIIDPFCGSGAFLISALRFLKAKGVSPQEAMPNIFGIDLNPSACIAARTNLVLFAAGSGVSDFTKMPINILCADSLTPAVIEGMRHSDDMLHRDRPHITVDGEIIDANPDSQNEQIRVAALLSRYGIATDRWLNTPSLPSSSSIPTTKIKNNGRERKIAEQLAVFMLRKADVVATNPPWVGWEYMSRPYRAHLNPAWEVYSLFEQKGLEAAFLKEDISTLCITTACDRYLRDRGNAALVIRPASMQSDLTARGLRRLSVFANSTPLKLTHIRLFEGLKVFGNAATPTATWHLSKGIKTTFPVPVTQWERKTPRWQPDASTNLDQVLENISVTEAVCSPINSAESSSRWAIGGSQTNLCRERIIGTNNLQPRIGFFTGGANAIYYMNKIGSKKGLIATCENITERAKRQVDKMTIELETDLLYPVVRGRDISYWNSSTEVFILCPHTAETKLYPLSEPILKEAYPRTLAYFEKMEPTLRERKGFAGWEKRIHQDFYYTLQRIGDYTFAPYKVCWSYISADFTISVVGPDKSGKPILPNDKVVFIAYDDPDSAYFTGGVLSSSPIRLAVVSSISARQVSANVIKHYGIPAYKKDDRIHQGIAAACRAGHVAMSQGDIFHATAQYEKVNSLVAQLYGFTDVQMARFTEELKRKVRKYPFHLATTENDEQLLKKAS